MILFHHLLPDDAILGIGPLMWEDHPSEMQAVVYATGRYFFELHLVAHTSQIKSEWFYRQGHSNTKKSREEMNAWKDEYWRVREILARRMGESTDEALTSRSQHIDKVSEVYELTKEELNDLLADLIPADHNEQPVNPRITKVFECVQSLRDLACK